MHGAVYFTAEMLATRGDTLEGKTCLIFGSGNAAQYAVEKILGLGGKAACIDYPPFLLSIERISYKNFPERLRSRRMAPFFGQYVKRGGL
ncbi:MAG: hypothetical protein JRC60_06875 [Deltaproteobacteria bacterium]|nr:hypothetical protein [Deltaproteobacteria bacterium]